MNLLIFSGFDIDILLLNFSRYGAEVGNLTENALSTAGNTYLTVYNAAALGPKGLAKRVVKNTGRVLVNAEPEQLELRRDSGTKSLQDNSVEKKE